MVDSKRYTPSNKRFQKHTQSFVEGKTMKGHLGEGNKDKNSYKTTGILKKINKNGIYSNGWYVEVDKKELQCTYGDNIVYLPPYTENGEWYFPKSKCEVEVSVNEKSSIFTITRIKDPNKQPITMTNNKITLSGNGVSSIEIGKDVVSVLGDQLTAQNDIKVDTSEQEDLPDEISVTDMYKEIQVLKGKIGDNNNVTGE